MYCLTEAEQEIFREDFREKEREIQRYIGVYLSGLVLVTGWIVGPQTKPLIKMALDNYGYNVYALLVLVVLNVLFTCFLIYKSLIVHEIMQFVTFHSEPECGFQYWENWHRSSQSATKRVRPFYTILLGILPLCISLLIMFGLFKLLRTDPQFLADKLKEIEAQANSLNPTPPGSLLPTSPAVTADQLASVFATAKIWFVAVVVLHAIPFWFFFENVVPTDRRWKIINGMHRQTSFYADLETVVRCTPHAPDRVTGDMSKEPGTDRSRVDPKQLAPAKQTQGRGAEKSHPKKNRGANQ